jgi:hypothetical protein
VIPGAAVHSGHLLSTCDLCGCLVVASALRARGFFVADRAGTLRRAAQLVCADPAACYARTPAPEHWTRLGAALPFGCDPDDGAALLMCHLCLAPGTAEQLSISREKDEKGWWEMVICADTRACEERQRIGPGPPGLRG